MSCFPILEGKAGDLQLLLLVFVVKIRLLVQKCEDLNDSVEKIADRANRENGSVRVFSFHTCCNCCGGMWAAPGGGLKTCLLIGIESGMLRVLMKPWRSDWGLICLQRRPNPS